jgi:hypothetical protein
VLPEQPDLPLVAVLAVVLIQVHVTMMQLQLLTTDHANTLAALVVLTLLLVTTMLQLPSTILHNAATTIVSLST